MEYLEFMYRMMDLPFEFQICESCGGSGLSPVMCCRGQDCGCMGMPTDFEPCKCGLTPITEENLIKVTEYSRRDKQ